MSTPSSKLKEKLDELSGQAKSVETLKKHFDVTVDQNLSINPKSCNIKNPFPSAEMFPKLPPGITIQSGTSHWNCWHISMLIVF